MVQRLTSLPGAGWLLAMADDELLRGADVTPYCCWGWTQISSTKVCTSTTVVFGLLWGQRAPLCIHLSRQVRGSAQPRAQVESLQDSSQDQQLLVF